MFVSLTRTTTTALAYERFRFPFRLLSGPAAQASASAGQFETEMHLEFGHRAPPVKSETPPRASPRELHRGILSKAVKTFSPSCRALAIVESR